LIIKVFYQTKGHNMRTRIIIDSASDLTKVQADAMQLDYMPMKTIFGEEEFLDGVTMTHEQFYEKLIESDTMPTTSQISPHDYEQMFADVKKNGDTAVVLTISSKLSGTYQSANIAREGYEDCIYLVDTQNVCLGEQILVQYACRLRDEGKSAAEIAAKLDEKKADVRVMALLDTLEYLKRGGRVSGAVAMAGNLLSIKPVIAVEQGEIAILGKARGSKNGNNMLRQEIAKDSGIDFSMPVCLGYTGLDDSMLRKYMADSSALWEGKIDLDAIPISTIGSTIGTHTGPGGICVSYFAVSE
jgi:DegV family protein with EDD domain